MPGMLSGRVQAATQMMRRMPFSLYFGGDDTIDCGSDASIMDLHDADMTLDLLVRSPAVMPAAAEVLISQGIPSTTSGWWLVWSQALAAFVFQIRDGGNTARSVSRAFNSPATWIYIRARRGGDTIYLSLDAAAEGSQAVAAGGTNSAAHLWIGCQPGPGGFLNGWNLGYGHLWASDMGALASLPMSPRDVDLTTRARWTLTKGSGAVLLDTSGQGIHGAISGATWSRVFRSGWDVAATGLQKVWMSGHWHTGKSPDGYGTEEDGYTEAEGDNITVVSSTDHSYNSGGVDEYTPAEWADTQAEVQAHYSEGTLVTLLAEEWTTPESSPAAPDTVCHFVIRFLDAAAAMVSIVVDATFAAMVARLAGVNALIENHHTGIHKLTPGDEDYFAVDFATNHDVILEQTFEIFNQKWGCIEADNAAHELSPDTLYPGDLETIHGDYFAQDLLEICAGIDGWLVGFTAGLDAHGESPGGPAHASGFAITGLWIDGVATREACFQALRERRTWAVAGSKRIQVKFTADGNLQGSEYQCAVGHQVVFAILAGVGWSTISWVEIVRYYEGAWSVEHREEPGTATVTINYTAAAITSTAIYYVRLALTDIEDCGAYGMRRPYAWASPVKVKPVVV